jgi:DNA polymerase kappa
MDMFYAAVEIRDNPELADKPIAVGDSSMISTANYIARKFGVRSAMPGFIGKKICPDLIFVPHHGEKYKAVGKVFRAIIEEYDPEFESMGLDEANLDVTRYLIEKGLNDDQGK